MVKTGLSWDKDEYVPVAQVALKKHTERELRQEYTRLRDIAQKRLARIGQSEFAESMTYKNFVGQFKTTRSIKDVGELTVRLAALAGFVETGTTVTSMKKQRAESLKTLHEHGYTYVTKENFVRFGQFMQAYRNANLDRVYDSKRAVKIFADKPDRKNVSPSRLKSLFEADEKRRLAEDGL